MIGSQNINPDVVLLIYRDPRSVFRLNDVALLTGETNFISLNKKLNYYVRTGKLLNPRKGIYAKPGYDPRQLICILYSPSYISLDYVLQKSGVTFQYDSSISAVSYLSRHIQVGQELFRYRRIKGEILINTAGIIRHLDHINIATPERALLDLLYLDGETHFDNLNPINKDLIFKLLPIYQSNTLNIRVKNIL
jgi:hypothetical protein